MVEFRRILCPVDFSDFSQHALDYATALARWYDARVRVVHVAPSSAPIVSAMGGYPVPMPLIEEDVESLTKQLEAFVEPARRQGITVDAAVLQGAVVSELLSLAAGGQADLIVMGTHGRGGFERLMLGSVTEKILRKATCPVLTVPKRVQHIPGTGELLFRNVVCPVDFSPSSMAALSLGLSIAEEADAKVTVVHVLEWFTERAPIEVDEVVIGEYRKQAEADARKRLDEAIPADARVWCHPEEVLVAGKPYREIVRVASGKQADLIVMGVHGRGVVDLALFGSTTAHVVREATCAVLTLRSE